MKAPLMQRAESIATSGNPRAQARFAFSHPRAAQRTGMQPPQQMGNADAAMAAMGQMQQGQAAMPGMPAPRQPIPSFQPRANEMPNPYMAAMAQARRF